MSITQSNRIMKIKVGSTSYPVVPQYLGDSSTDYVATLPTLTADSVLSLSTHTHTTTLATDTGTSSITLSHGGKYKLTAGGTSVIFTMPSSGNTDTKVTQTVTTSENTYYRPILIGDSSSNASTPTFSTITSTCYAAAGVYIKPSTGALYATNLYKNGTEVSTLQLGSTSTTAAAGDHAHTLSLATDTGTSTVSLSANQKYKLTAGGNNVIFTTPKRNTYASNYNNTVTLSGYTDITANFNSTNDTITVTESSSTQNIIALSGMSETSVKVSELNSGDIICFENSDVPDRWVSRTRVGWTLTYTFYALEGKGGGSALPTTTTANKVLLSTTTSGSVAWSSGALSSSSTKPLYLSSSGVLTAGSTYAGGTKVTLNNSNKGASTASFYAPTSGGTSGKLLVGNGTTSAPVWSSWSTAGLLKTDTSGVVSVDTTSYATKSSTLITSGTFSSGAFTSAMSNFSAGLYWFTYAYCQAFVYLSPELIEASYTYHSPIRVPMVVVNSNGEATMGILRIYESNSNLVEIRLQGVPDGYTMYIYRTGLL